jgi:hypothetical protein
MKKFDLNSFNALVNKYLSPQGMNDLNRFLEEFPARAGYGVLIAGGIVWLIAGLGIVYATTLAKNVSDIRTELIKTEALKPVVPTISTQAVSSDEIANFAARTNPLYKDINITSIRDTINVASSSGRYFGAFRESINHAYNGGTRWRLAIDYLCVGRECQNGFLQGSFKVNTLSINR